MSISTKEDNTLCLSSEKRDGRSESRKKTGLSRTGGCSILGGDRTPSASGGKEEKISFTQRRREEEGAPIRKRERVEETGRMQEKKDR